MRVVFVNRYFHPDESATSRMVSSLAFGLAEAGTNVVIVTGRYRHDDPEVALPRRESIGGVEVHRIATSHFGRQRLAGRAADYASFHAGAAIWCLARLRRGDIVVSSTDPPLLSVTLAVACAIRGARLVNWLHDIFPEVAIELGMIDRRSRRAQWLLAARDWSLRRAVRNVAPTAAMARGLGTRGIEECTIAIVPYWSEENEIRPVGATENPLRTQWGLKDKFVVGYSGNFGRAHEFATLLDAAERLRKEPRVRFLLIGGGYGRRQVEDETRRRRLDNVLLRPLQPREQLAESLCAADVHLVSLLPALEPYVVPSKLYGILAAGRPALFVGAGDGEVATLLHAQALGHTVAIGDGAALAARILEMSQAGIAGEAMGRRARKAFERDHLRSRAIADWLELFRGLEPRPAGRRGADRRFGLFGRLGRNR